MRVLEKNGPDLSTQPAHSFESEMIYSSETSRPRIAFISVHGMVTASPRLGSTDTGGQVAYVLELAKGLARLGWTVDIWTRQFDDGPAAETVAEHVSIMRVPCGPPCFLRKEDIYPHLQEWAESAVRKIRAQGLEYSCVNSHYWDSGVAGLRLAACLAIPHCHTPHSVGLWKSARMRAGDETDAYRTARVAAEREVYRQCEILIATSPMQERLIGGAYGIAAEKFRTVSPGYDEDRFFPVNVAGRDRARKKFGFTGPTVVAVGRVAENKGYGLLLNAFKAVKTALPRSRLHLAIGGCTVPNDGERRILDNILRECAAAGLTADVHLGRFVPDDDLADFYRAADVFVLSSVYEPFGMTALEAIACGTATIVTRHGGLCEMISPGRDALCADPENSEELAAAITRVLGDSHFRRALGTSGAEQARDCFTWHQAAIKMAELCVALQPVAAKLPAPVFAAKEPEASVEYLLT